MCYVSEDAGKPDFIAKLIAKRKKKLYIIFTRCRPETFIDFNTFYLSISRVYW